MKHSKELEALINAAIQDGKLDDKEKTVLFKRAQSEGISPDEFEIYINSRLNRKKEEAMMLQKKRMERERNKPLIVSAAFLALIVALGLVLEIGDIKEANENYGWSYEKACENGDFEVAHNILNKLQNEVLEEKKWEKDHQIKKEKKSHWFKDDEIVVDSVSLLDHEQYVQGLQNKGRAYLAGLDYVYNAEIAFVKESNEDDSSEKVKHLLSELRTKIILFKSLDMEEEAQDVYNKLTQKVAPATNESAVDSSQIP